MQRTIVTLHMDWHNFIFSVEATLLLEITGEHIL